jgi:hypothetical protein
MYCQGSDVVMKMVDYPLISTGKMVNLEEYSVENVNRVVSESGYQAEIVTK